MNGRKSNGQFEKGHPSLISKGGTNIGRKKTIKRQVKDALQIAEDAMPDIIRAMIKRAKGEEGVNQQVQQAAAEYLCDRIYGRPNQPIKLRGELSALIAGVQIGEAGEGKPFKEKGV